MLGSTTSWSTAATVMALVEKTFSHLLNGCLLVSHQRCGREKPCGAVQGDQAAADSGCQVGLTLAAGAKQQQKPLRYRASLAVRAPGLQS